MLFRLDVIGWKALGNTDCLTHSELVTEVGLYQPSISHAFGNFTWLTSGDQKRMGAQVRF